jgi:hypothetical protein
MSEGSKTRDLVTLTRESMEATNRSELHADSTMFSPDAIFDVSPAGVGRFEGVDAVHRYLADWTGSYDTQELREWRGEDLGGGVVFVDALFEAQPRGGPNAVRERWGGHSP